MDKLEEIIKDVQSGLQIRAQDRTAHMENVVLKLLALWDLIENQEDLLAKYQTSLQGLKPYIVTNDAVLRYLVQMHFGANKNELHPKKNGNQFGVIWNPNHD